MPYADFTDTSAVKLLYHSLQQEDNDLDLAEFVGDKLLGLGELFENDDADQPCQDSHHNTPPIAIQIQAGSLICNECCVRATAMVELPIEQLSIFIDNKFARKLPVSIFHPPSLA